jgi:hypothetical protein
VVVTAGAVFYMDPTTMGANSGADPIVMAQMTLSADDAASGTATARLLFVYAASASPPPPPPPPPPLGSGAESVTVVSTDGVMGMTTDRLSYTLDATQANYLCDGWHPRNGCTVDHDNRPVSDRQRSVLHGPSHHGREQRR